MTKIIKEFEVRAPPERVFEKISKPEKYPQWADFVKSASGRGPKSRTLVVALLMLGVTLAVTDEVWHGPGSMERGV